MEDTLRAFVAFKKLVKDNVLILVLMEDTLRVFTFNANIDDTSES